MKSKPILVEVGNLRTQIDIDRADELNHFFTFKPKGYFFSPGYKQGWWNGEINLMKFGKVATGLFLQYRKTMEKEGFRFDVTDLRAAPLFEERTFEAEPRIDQKECVAKMIQNSNTGGIILNATGTGKTFVAAYYFSKLRRGGVFIVDELTLADQTQKELSRLMGEEVGFIGGGKWKPKRITVALVQSLQSKIGKDEFAFWAADVDVIIYDELHMAINKRSKEVLWEIRPYAVFGLTATLETDKKHSVMEAYELTGPVLYRFPYADALKAGVLAPGIVLGVDFLRTHPKQMPYQELYRMMISENNRWNSLIVALAEEGVKRGYHVVVLTDLPGHVKTLSKQLGHIPHNTIHGERKSKLRIKAKERFEEGQRQLLIANRVFKKGINIKILDVIIDGAGLGNVNDIQQKFGRGVRILDGKKGLLYFHLGDKKPKVGVYSMNTFQARTNRSRKVLKANGIPIVVLKNKDYEPAGMYDEAEKALSQIVVPKSSL